MSRYGSPKELEFIDTVAPFARQAASEGPGALERFIGYVFLMYLKRFPTGPDPEGRNDWHPEVEAALRRREREFTMVRH
jgi:hypothetical protein